MAVGGIKEHYYESQILVGDEWCSIQKVYTDDEVRNLRSWLKEFVRESPFLVRILDHSSQNPHDCHDENCFLLVGGGHGRVICSLWGGEDQTLRGACPLRDKSRV